MPLTNIRAWTDYPYGGGAGDAHAGGAVYLAYEAVEEKIAGEGNLSRLPGNINEPGADAQTAGAEKKNAGSVSLSPGEVF